MIPDKCGTRVGYPTTPPGPESNVRRAYLARLAQPARFQSVQSRAHSTSPPRRWQSSCSIDGLYASEVRDGTHDFDFEIGKWHTHVHRLLHPLTGSDVWADYEGTSVIP